MCEVDIKMSIGQIVYSKAGRDSGRPFIILEISEDGNFVYLVDGKLRRVEKPKKKKVKHIEMTDYIDTVIAEKLSSNQKVNNAEVRKAIKRYLQFEGKEEGYEFGQG